MPHNRWTQKTRLLTRIAPAFLGVALAACGGDSTAPSQPLAGSYTASAFMTTGASGQTNQLLIGSTLQITLASDGSTTGHLHLAASGAFAARDDDMGGTWTTNGNVVNFHQPADTFVRDMNFVLDPIATGVWDLVGDQNFSGTRIQLTLSRLGTL